MDSLAALVSWWIPIFLSSGFSWFETPLSKVQLCHLSSMFWFFLSAPNTSECSGSPQPGHKQRISPRGRKGYSKERAKFVPRDKRPWEDTSEKRDSSAGLGHGWIPYWEAFLTVSSVPSISGSPWTAAIAAGSGQKQLQDCTSFAISHSLLPAAIAQGPPGTMPTFSRC